MFIRLFMETNHVLFYLFFYLDNIFILVRTPWFANYSACKDFGVLSCENVFIDGHVGKLGAW